MRVIAGKYGSRPLRAPRGMTTRPTLDQTREALFNMLQGRTEAARFLDLYAGTGAVALEALSRGAQRAVLCDQSRAACACIRENIRSLGCEAQARLLEMPDIRAIALLAREGMRFDLVYLDPPYAMNLTQAMTLIVRSDLLAPGALLITETDATSAPAAPDGLRQIRRKVYRDTALTFFEAEER